MVGTRGGARDKAGAYDWQVMVPDPSKTSSLPVLSCPQTTTTLLGTITGKVDNGPLYAKSLPPPG